MSVLQLAAFVDRCESNAVGADLDTVNGLRPANPVAVVDLHGISLVKPHDELAADLVAFPAWPPVLAIDFENRRGKAAPGSVSHLDDIDMMIFARHQGLVFLLGASIGYGN